MFCGATRQRWTWIALGNLLIGLGEYRGLNDVGLAIELAFSIADVCEHTVRVAGLGFAPGRHDLDRFAERVLDSPAVALGGVDALFSRRFVAIKELLPRDDILLTRGIGHNPVTILCGVDRLLGAACEHSGDCLTRNCRPSLHTTLLLVDRSFGQCRHDLLRLPIDLGKGHC